MLLDVSFEVGHGPRQRRTCSRRTASRRRSRGCRRRCSSRASRSRRSTRASCWRRRSTRPTARYDALFLNNYAMINVRDALLRVKGVASVDLIGGAEYGMRVWLRPERPGDARPDARRRHRRDPGAEPAGAGRAGRRGRRRAPGQQFTYTVRAPGRLVTAEEFGEIIVRSTDEGARSASRTSAASSSARENYKLVRIRLGRQARRRCWRSTCCPAPTRSQAAEGIYATLEELKRLFPTDVDYKIVYDTTPAVEASIEEIITTLFEAVILVVIVVVRVPPERASDVHSAAHRPGLAARHVHLLPAARLLVNTLTMFGLVLAIGIVVDDAIVVVEAVMHHIEHGMDREDGHRQGDGRGLRRRSSASAWC